MLSAFKNNPLYLLAFCGLVERLINFGIFSVLVLRLQQFFHFSDQQAFILFGLFTALSYAGLVLGGFVSDRWLGLRASLSVGGLLLFFSALLLSISQLDIFYLGLALLILGTALYKVSCTSLVGLLSGMSSQEKEKGYTWFYSAMNVGAVLGPVLYGALSILFSWKACLLFSALLILTSILLFISNKNIRKQLILLREHSGVTSVLIGYATVGITIIAVFALFEFFQDSGLFMFAALIICAFSLFLLLAKQPKIHQKHIIGLLILSIFCMFFFACSFQVSSSITLYIQKDVNPMLGGWSIPAPVFTALDPLFVVLMAPVLSLIWKKMASQNREPMTIVKISIALGLASLAFVFLYLSTIANTHANHKIVLFTLFCSYIFLGAGEICLMPSMLSALSKYTPEAFKTTMMGVFYLFIAGAGYFAGLLSRLSDKPQQVKIFHANLSGIYGSTFAEIAFFAIVAGGLLLILKPRLNYFFS